MENREFKTKGKFISQTVIKVLKNLGKFVKSPINAMGEFNFFFEIKNIYENKYKCKVNIIPENESQEKKAAQGLPGKPAIIIK